MLVAVFAPKAMACPFCDGGPSGVNEVREGIFDDNFWPRVAATLAPFPILAGIVALIYFGPPELQAAAVGRGEVPRVRLLAGGLSLTAAVTQRTGDSSCRRQGNSTAAR